MNFSAYNSTQSNISSTPLRDTFATALTKNIIVVVLCISINYINATLIHTFFRHSIFKENPRYILFVHLVVNDMIQLTIAVLLHVVSYVFFTINVSLCCVLLMIAISTTYNTPLNLASMAVERYIAVCNPLRHAQICTVRRTHALIGIIWTLGVVPILPDLFVILATEPVSFFHSSVFCNRDPVFRHPYLREKKNISFIAYLCLVWLTLVYTYFRILFAAKAMKSDARKARNTILLHAAQLCMCMFTYIGPLLDTVLLYIFPMYVLEMRFTSYLIIHILPRFLSPIIYGLRDKVFQKYFKRYLLCKVDISIHQKNVSTVKSLHS
ncbi:odorant receptor 131-2-like [Megalops cyprinoides]|uniref:odorant receptor 131-2-like n=1 Tax=Megalops cyprinoides TaxID=118141 RepID=UPI001864AB38|nr:odorant receptor 131-2-like [Megalops cyprinoides]